ncbi:MAG: methyltransferase domain-containing protein [Candidatus Hydrothermarchaeota archaeon]|nr:methyltransferase domain-containing protein [Candidatus Hydrothermarchaeota archaeon]
MLCSEVLEHIPHPRRALKELYRILDTQGVIIITVPNEGRLTKKIPYSIKRILGVRSHSETERYRRLDEKIEKSTKELGIKFHTNRFSPYILRRLLNTTGFKNIKITGVRFVIPPFIINKFPSSAKFFIKIDRVLSNFNFFIYFMWNIVVTAKK